MAEVMRCRRLNSPGLAGSSGQAKFELSVRQVEEPSVGVTALENTPIRPVGNRAGLEKVCLHVVARFWTLHPCRVQAYAAGGVVARALHQLALMANPPPPATCRGCRDHQDRDGHRSGEPALSAQQIGG